MRFIFEEYIRKKYNNILIGNLDEHYYPKMLGLDENLFLNDPQSNSIWVVSRIENKGKRIRLNIVNERIQNLEHFVLNFFFEGKNFTYEGWSEIWFLYNNKNFIEEKL